MHLYVYVHVHVQSCTYMYIFVCCRARVKGIEGLDKSGVEAAVDFLHASSELKIEFNIPIKMDIVRRIMYSVHVHTVYE